MNVRYTAAVDIPAVVGHFIGGEAGIAGNDRVGTGEA